MTNVDESAKPAWWIRLIIGRRPRRTLLRLMILLGASFVLFKFLVLPIRVVGASMEPSFRNGKVNLVNRLAYRRAKPQRGDVAAIRVPGERDLWLKRIVGLPGDKLVLKDGRIYINGQPLEEPYVRLRGKVTYPRVITVEPEHYFVIGDNRAVSVFRSVGEWQIVGKVMF